MILPILLLAKGSSTDPYHMQDVLEKLVIGMGLVAVVAAGYGLYQLLNVTLEYEQERYLEEHGIAAPEATTADAPEVETENWFKKLWQKANAFVPVAEEADVMLDHDYDGIRELDNKLPPWWLYMFYATILFAAVYLKVYHFSDGAKGTEEVYAEQMREAEIQRNLYLSRQANLVNEKSVEALTDPKDLAVGKSIYDANCVVCHGQQGEGGVGPNMTDEYWLHGGSIKDVFRVIKYGVPDKGMISWSNQLRPVDIQKVSSYIMTFGGTNPPNAKEPQGKLYKAE